MSISLQKGQKISLTKDNSSLDKIILGLGWDQASEEKSGFFSMLGKKANIDCDATAMLLQNGKMIDKKDIVYFGNLKHYTNSVRHTGDNLTGEGDGDDEQIIVELKKVPQNYDKIVIVVNIFKAKDRKQHFGMIKNAFIRLIDTKTNKEMCRYNLTDDYSGCTALIFGEVYRHNEEWKFNAIGQGTTDDGIGELAARYK
ncbi:TerD family protein [Fusobacterium sp.]|uniref:TerD family protein n=1 Tax=Fusobacterium sp. TaxID=68766 RepID=UPI00290249F7|nr:TerD family protein [Fusobacterium sp.]MDU1910276.1 TerD family protein [Fusobacterium sp.]